jgi:NAD(P)H dehydrogenase (quinone)
MSRVKLVVVYYSSTGTNYQMALAVKEAAEKMEAEVRLCKVHELAPDEAIDQNPNWRAHAEATKDIPEATLDDLEWGDAYIFGSPTRFGNVAAQVKQFIDMTGGIWSEGKLTDKVVAGFTSAKNPHGGQESTLLALYNTFHHWGCIIVPPGYTDKAVFAGGGNPYGVSSNAAPGKKVPEAVLDAARHMARRVVKVAQWVVNGKMQ